MNAETTSNIYKTRMLIGFLGEKHQESWWGSAFLNNSSITFLKPIFPKTTILAQYSGVCKAASIVHDDRIGIGKNYHLYRLPDSIERLILKYIQSYEIPQLGTQNLTSKDEAIKQLNGLGVEKVKKSEGPVIVGDYSDDLIDSLICKIRSYYHQAFLDGYKTFPYMRSK